MGQYFIVANTTKKEYLHPHYFGQGLKFAEFPSDGVGVMTALAHLLGQSTDHSGMMYNPEITGQWIGDHVVIVGDYDESSTIYRDAMSPTPEESEYTNISAKLILHLKNDTFYNEVLNERRLFTSSVSEEVTTSITTGS